MTTTLDDLKKSVDELKNADNTTLKEIGGFIGAVSNIAGALQLPGAIIQFIPQLESLFLGKKDPTEELLNSISEKLDAVYSFDIADEALTQMQLVAGIVHDASDRLKSTLEETLPFSSTTLDDTQKLTFTAASKLSDRVFWQRVFADVLVYRDSWFGPVIPPTVNGGSGRTFVFDYRLTMPAFLQVLGVRLTSVLLLLGVGFVQRDAVHQEIRSLAKTLHDFHTEIVSGLIEARLPTRDEVDPRISVNPPLPESDWDTRGRVFGAVDMYSGDGSKVEAWPDREFPATFAEPDPQQNFDLQYRTFVVSYRVSSRKRRLALYQEIGLPDVWSTLQLLRDATGEDRDGFDRDACWSLSDIGDIVNSVLPGNPGGFQPGAVTVALVISKMLSLLPNTTSIQTNSLRAVINAMAH